MSKTATRLYEVRDSTLLDTHPPRLVEATSAAAAIRFVASKYKASVPDTKRVAALMSEQKVVVERAQADA